VQKPVLSSVQEGIFGAPSLCVRAGSAVFDAQNLVSSAGLVPVLELAGQTRLSRLIGEQVDLPAAHPTSPTNCRCTARVWRKSAVIARCASRQ
jgi:hypothetical protein